MTREDYYNLADEIVRRRDVSRAKALIQRLLSIRQHRTSLFLRPGVQKPPEELAPDDYEPREDPVLEYYRLGMKDEEFDFLIRRLSDVV